MFWQENKTEYLLHSQLNSYSTTPNNIRVCIWFYIHCVLEAVSSECAWQVLNMVLFLVQVSQGTRLGASVYTMILSSVH